MRSLAGRTALVTGAAGGIGLGIARVLAEHGAQVCLADKQFDGLGQTAASIGPDASAIFLDLEDVEAINKAVTEVADRLGKIDILVNAAGFAHWEGWDQVTIENFNRIVAINCRGLLFLTHSVARAMVSKETRGSIINVASIAARRGDPTNVVYSMTKSAVISLTQSAAAAYAPKGIRVNAIAPGYVQTAMMDKLFAHHGQRLNQDRAEQEKNVLLRVPLGRMGTPEDQANAVLFLASDDSSYVTGQTLNVDGGIYMH
jgi:NAD(P)-dependent dehydrogenase (short-subunit alcohol dehydrogenase family)